MYLTAHNFADQSSTDSELLFCLTCENYFVVEDTIRPQSVIGLFFFFLVAKQSVTWLLSVSKGGTHSAGDPELSPFMRWNRLTSPSVWSGMKNKCHGGWHRASVSYQPGQCEWWFLSGPLLRGCLLSQGGRVVLGREENWETLRDPSLRRSPSSLIWLLHG